MLVVLDFETNRRPTSNPYSRGSKAISYSLSIDGGKPEFHYHTAIEFRKALREAFEGATRVIGFNLKFDLGWAARLGIHVPERCKIWDCQIAEFLISGQQNRMPSLDGALERVGLEAKKDILEEYWAMGIDTEGIPAEELEEYNNHDVQQTYLLAMKQLKEMSPELQRLCTIQGADLLVLQEMEENGQLFNRDLCAELLAEAQERVSKLESTIREVSPYKDINLGSGHHMSCLLYGGYLEVDEVETQTTQVYKSGAKKGQEYVKTTWKTVPYTFPALFTPLKNSKTRLTIKTTKGGYPVYQSGAEQIQQLSARTKEQKLLVETLLEYAKLEKLVGTYYTSFPALMDEMEWGNYLHGQFNQVVARTGRLSSSAPNMQNTPGEVDALLCSRY